MDTNKFTKIVEMSKNILSKKGAIIVLSAFLGALVKHFTSPEIDKVIDKALITIGVPESALKTMDMIFDEEEDD